MYFSVTDPLGTLDPNLSDVAKFLSAYLDNDEKFHKFGAQLVGAKSIDLVTIKKQKVELQQKCLQLIELWIKSTKSLKWLDLIQAASKSNLGGLAMALTAELQVNDWGKYYVTGFAKRGLIRGIINI